MRSPQGEICRKLIPDISNPLEWKNIYLIFVGAWPLMAAAAFITVSAKTGAIQAMDGLNCDITYPLW